MAQRVIGKLGTVTSAAATQVTLSLPATAISPATGTATSGISLIGIDYLIVVAQASAAVALTQGLTIFGNDAAGSFAGNGIQLALFSVPAAVTTPFAYYFGPGLGSNDGVPANGFFGAGGVVMDKMAFQATPGAASTVTITVYGIRSIP